MPRTNVARAATIIRRILRSAYPEWFIDAGRVDVAGNPMTFHPPTDGHPATLVWESVAWCDYEILDRCAVALEDAGLPVALDVMNSYEATLEDCS